jgi:hypothetical protein
MTLVDAEPPAPPDPTALTFMPMITKASFLAKTAAKGSSTQQPTEAIPAARKIRGRRLEQ